MATLPGPRLSAMEAARVRSAHTAAAQSQKEEMLQATWWQTLLVLSLFLLKLTKGSSCRSSKGPRLILL